MARWHCCNREFESEEALARHDVEAHGVEREPVGTCCGLRFYTPEGLEEHVRAAHGRGSREAAGN